MPTKKQLESPKWWAKKASHTSKYCYWSERFKMCLFTINKSTVYGLLLSARP